MITLSFLWILFSFVPAAIASSKGRSGFGFFLLSFIFSPLIGLIAALIASPASKPQTIIVNPAQSAPKPTSHIENDIASLERLAALKNSGVITNEEFEKEKSQLLHGSVSKRNDLGVIDFKT